MVESMRVLGAGALAAALAMLVACDNGPSAVAAQAPQQPLAAQTEVAQADAGEGQADHRKDPVKLVDGKPMWSASRRYSAEENAQRNFERNGRDFGADTVDEFVQTAHAFVDKPPRGALTLTRSNGDTLIYDAKANVFAVATKAGAPRTMFKPREGMAYWEEQKAREAKRQTARADRSSGEEDS